MPDFLLLFCIILQNELSKSLAPIIKEHHDNFAAVIDNNLFNKNGPKKLKRYRRREEHFLFERLFKPFIEIYNSFENLNYIQLYLKKFPYRNKYISKIEYLRYHFSNYLNQNYMLHQRIKSFYTIIMRAYKGDHIDLSQLKEILTLIDNFMIKVNDKRGEHVHQNYFNDDSLNRLSLIDFYYKAVEDGNIKKVFFDYFTTEFNKSRSHYLTLVSNQNKSLTVLIDAFFKVLVVNITKDGKLIIPRNIDNKSSEDIPE